MQIYRSGAHLYDVAFSWDLSDEVSWLLDRLGGHTQSVLEPGCGSGRMFPAFARHGVEVFGVDASEEMLTRAAQRMTSKGYARPRTLCADMACFDFGRTFDGAICPINTFGYLLTRADALSHLNAVGRHLEAGGTYLVQVDLVDMERHVTRPADRTSRWESEADGLRVKTTVSVGRIDRGSRTRTEHFHLEIVEGADKGIALEEDHTMRVWDWSEWSELIGASPFRQLAAYDGSAAARPALDLGPNLNTARLTWHELGR